MKLSEKIDQDMAEITTPTMQTGAVKVWAQHIAGEVRKLEAERTDRRRAELIALTAGALANPRALFVVGATRRDLDREVDGGRLGPHDIVELLANVLATIDAALKEPAKK